MTKKVPMIKYSFNLDACIAIFLVFVISFGMNFYQRYQYSDLLHEHIELQTTALRMEYAVSFMKASLDNCENGKAAGNIP
ncbi:MAG TPA: hypothetical protein VJ981_07730 [Gammaproteobacteria bacterium]|nr:hypothetical protein [Gammaproteobacteria bacterium]